MKTVDRILRLQTEGLALTLQCSCPDAEGWLSCELNVQVPGFSGNYRCSIWQPSLEAFRDELADMIRQLGQPSNANFTNIEPGIELQLSMNKLGQIEGRYALENDTLGRPTLSGHFRMDQSYLEGLLQQVNGLVED